MHSLWFRLTIAVLAIFASAPVMSAQTSARRFEIAGHLAVTSSGQFGSRDPGIGARVAWFPWPLVGAEAEVTLYPREYPNARGFSRRRWEGFFGATLGPRLGRVRPFASIRPGFLRYSGAEGPIACILIYPPPLSCTLASGATIFAADLGGGVDVAFTERTFLRVNAADRALRYEGPVFDGHRVQRDANFWTHELRVAIGAGFRF